MEGMEDLQTRVTAWNEQAANGQISYRELEQHLRKAGKDLNAQFSSRTITPDEYMTRQEYLVLVDVDNQTWTLSNTGWRRRTPEGKWEEGKPNLESAKGSGRIGDQGSRILQIAVAAIVGLLLLVGLGGLWRALEESQEAVIVQPTEPTTEAPTEPTATPTETATTEPTSPPTAEVTDEADIVSPTAEPSPSPSEPSVTPSPEPTEEPTIEATEEAPVPTEEPTLEPVVTSTVPLTVEPRPEPTPYGTLAYATFDDRTGAYNLRLRTWPDFEVALELPGSGQPAINRNGTSLAFRSWDSQQGLVKYDLISGTETFINIVEAIRPAWAPSGDLAYMANNMPDQQWHIYINNNDHLIPIDGSIGGPAWLSSERLVFHGCPVNIGCGIHLANLDGSNLRRLTNSGNSQHLNPAPSPDGAKIAFMSNQGNNWDVYVIATDASIESPPTRLTSSAAPEGLPVWSPDGLWIAYVSNQSGRWFMEMVPAAGGDAQTLFELEGPSDGFVVAGPPGQEGWLHEQIAWFK